MVLHYFFKKKSYNCFMKHSFDTVLYAVYISLKTSPYLFLEVTLHAWNKLSFPHSLFVNMVRDDN